MSAMLVPAAGLRAAVCVVSVRVPPVVVVARALTDGAAVIPNSAENEEGERTDDDEAACCLICCADVNVMVNCDLAACVCSVLRIADAN